VRVIESIFFVCVYHFLNVLLKVSAFATECCLNNNNNNNNKKMCVYGASLFCGLRDGNPGIRKEGVCVCVWGGGIK
jgi:hypothetical protein